LWREQKMKLEFIKNVKLEYSTEKQDITRISLPIQWMKQHKNDFDEINTIDGEPFKAMRVYNLNDRFLLLEPLSPITDVHSTIEKRIDDSEAQ